MRQYSVLVGTLLKRAPVGPGEVSWTTHIRSSQYRAYRMASWMGSRSFCNKVVEQLVDRLVPGGSTYLQYGNCGEGGHVGACLAKSAGFRDSEIRVCASRNDHFFAMVKHENPFMKWCILDRWKIAGDNFRCGIDVDTADDSSQCQRPLISIESYVAIARDQQIPIGKYVNDGDREAINKISFAFEFGVAIEPALSVRGMFTFGSAYRSTDQSAQSKAPIGRRI